MVYMNLAAFQDAQNMRNFSSVQSCISASPLMVLSILPRPGRFNFQAKIPFRDEGFGVKPKWNFSEKQSKLYVAKMTTFPISISTSHHIPGATIVVCPIFTKSCHRFIGVIRCHNCLVRDPNPDAKEHVIQIENKGSQYFTDDHRHMVSVPLPRPAPGEDEVILYTKVGCNTSCPGGPNRRPFGILLRLVVGDEEFGRQFIDLKCCEGPARDMKKEEKQSDMEFNNYGPSVQSTSTEMQMAEIVENISNKRRLKQDQKSTNKKQRLESFFKKEECEYLLIPKIFTKETKKFLNYLYDKKFVKSTETVFTESDSTA